MKLKPYPAYKDSGLPWLGKIPAHWQVRRSGRLFAQRGEPGFPDLPILEVSLRTGVRVRDMDDTKRKQLMSNREQYKRAARSDIAYNMMRMWQGAVGVVPTDGLVSPAYIVARPFPEVESRYYGYLFRTAAYMNEVNKYSRGIVTDRNPLYWDEFKQIPSIYPPLDEQRKIADVLDSHERIVRRFIRAKRRLIELFNEQKQAIIHRAVTRGLDPNVRLKPSRIDWLGDVPEQWEVCTLKQVTIIRLSGVDKHTVEGERPIQLCNYTDVYNRDFISSDIEFMPASATDAEITGLTLRAGDVLITKDSEVWDDIAVPALVTENLNGVLCGYHLALIRPIQSHLVGEFLFHAFAVPALARQFHMAANGVTRYGLSKHAIKNAVIPVPPVQEQEAICRWIVDHLKPIASSMDRAQKEVDLIREYRTRLIADVVTGKLDVRGVELPALDETALLDDLDDDEVAELAEKTNEVEANEEEDSD